VDVCRLLKDYPHSVDLSVFGLDHVKMSRKFNLSSEFLAHKKKWWTVMEVVDFMRERYCGSVAVEYTHLSDRFQRSWLKTIFESSHGINQEAQTFEFQAPPTAHCLPSKRRSCPLGGSMLPLTDEEKKEALEILVRSDHLERFLGNKFPAVKRFGIEGAEAVLPGLHALIRRGAHLGV